MVWPGLTLPISPTLPASSARPPLSRSEAGFDVLRTTNSCSTLPALLTLKVTAPLATAAGLGATLNSLSVTALACAGAAAAAAGAVAAAGAATETVFDGVPSSLTATATRLASAMMSARPAKNAKAR